MIRRRGKRISQLDQQLDNQLQHLTHQEKQVTSRLIDSNFSIIKQTNKKIQDSEIKFKLQVLNSLKNIHTRIDNLQDKMHKHNTTTTKSKQRRNTVVNILQRKKGSINNQSVMPLGTKRKKSLSIQYSNPKFKGYSMITPKNNSTFVKNQYSSVKLLQQMICQQMSILKQSGKKQQKQLEQSKSNKKIIENRIKKISNVIQNEKNMENKYRNLQWQTKQLVETLNQTRSLCTYQKQKLSNYKEKLKLFKKAYGKQNV